MKADQVLLTATLAGAIAPMIMAAVPKKAAAPDSGCIN
jgi:hypothetical protein